MTHHSSSSSSQLAIFALITLLGGGINMAFPKNVEAHIKCPFKVFGATNDKCPIHDHPKVIDKRTSAIPDIVQKNGRTYTLISSKDPTAGEKRYAWSPTRAVYVEDTFSTTERQMFFGSSFAIIFGHVKAYNKPEEMKQCVIDYTSENEESVGAKWDQFVDYVVGDQNRIFVAREDDATLDRLASATVGSVGSSGDFDMTINLAHFPNLRDNPNGRSDILDEERDVLTGVLVHEMLHNIGHNHPKSITQTPATVTTKDGTRNTIVTNVAGNFVYEAGWCITRSGGDKIFGEFGLTDNGGKYVD